MVVTQAFGHVGQILEERVLGQRGSLAPPERLLETGPVFGAWLLSSQPRTGSARLPPNHIISSPADHGWGLTMCPPKRGKDSAPRIPDPRPNLSISRITTFQSVDT